MAEPVKLTTFIIALIWIGFIAGVLGLFIGNLTLNYGVQYSENNTRVYDKITRLDKFVNSTREVMSVSEDTDNLFDIVGGYFSSGYQALKTFILSLDIFTDMTNEGLLNPDLNIPSVGGLKAAIIMTVTVLLIIGIVASTLVKREL